MRKWVWDHYGARLERPGHRGEPAFLQPTAPRLPLHQLLFISVIALLVVALAGLSSNSRGVITFGHPAAAALSAGCPTSTPAITPTPTSPATTPTPTNGDGDNDNENCLSGTPTATATPGTADLSVTKTGSPNPVSPSSNLTYTITVSNSGPATAEGVVALDSLPSGVTFVFSSASQGTCVFVTCNLGSIAPGASATITVKVKVDPDTAGQITNTACVSSSTPDTNLGNNCDSTTTTVTTPTPTPTLPPGGTPTPTEPRADLSLIKVDTPDPASAGGNLTYGITVTNNGPDPAPNVVVNDALPPGVALISATPGQGTCSGTTCDLGTLAPGDSAAIAVVVEVGIQADPQITNIACATSSITDPNQANNCDDETTTVMPSVTPTALPAASTPQGPAGFPISGGLSNDGSWGSWLLLAIGLSLLTLGGGALYLSHKRKVRLDL